MNGDALLIKMSEKRFKMQDLASFLGVNLSTLYRKLNGLSDFTRIEIQNISSYLSLTREEIFEIFFAKELA